MSGEWIGIPGWSYEIHTESLEVRNKVGNILRLRSDGRVRLSKNGRLKRVTPKSLLLAAKAGTPLRDTSNKRAASQENRYRPWAILRQFDLPGGVDEYYLVKLVEGPSILSLPPNIPGVKSWATPEMLGVDAPLLPVGAAGA